MIRTPEEIASMFNQGANRLEPLQTRMINDYGAWRLTPFKLEGKYSNVTCNDPRVLCDKVVDTLAFAKLRFEIASGKSGKKKRNLKSAGEQLIIGSLNMADSRREAMTLPSTQAAMAWLGTVLGGFATRVWVHKEETDGPTIVDIAVWDLINTVWEIGRNGLAYVINRRTVNSFEAEQWGVDLEGKHGILYDYYDNDDNYVVISHTTMPVKGTTQFTVGKTSLGTHNPLDMGHIPVMISMAGATPFLSINRYSDTLADTAESIMAADRALYPIKNKLLTLYLTIVSEGAHNPLAITSEDGKTNFKKSPYYAGAVVQLNASKGEKVEPLYKPEAPNNTMEIMTEVMREISMGGLAPVAHGQVDTALPGYGIQLLTHNTASVIEPRKNIMEKPLSWMGREIFTQFGDGGFKSINVHGRINTNEQFVTDIKASDIKGDWYPEAILEPKLPEDEAQKMVMAQIAVINRLMSRGEAREKILRIRDSESSEDRIVSEDMDKQPGIMLQRMIRIAKENDEPELAAALPMIFGMTQPQLGGEGGPPAGAGGERTSFEGVKDPNLATGVRPEIFPNQQTGMANTETSRVAENMRLSRAGLVRGQ